MPRVPGELMQSRALFCLIPGFLDAVTCRRLRAVMDSGVAEPAEVLGSEVVIDQRARRASDIEVDPPTLAAVELKLESARAAIACRSTSWRATSTTGFRSAAGKVPASFGTVPVVSIDAIATRLSKTHGPTRLGGSSRWLSS